MKNYTRCSNCQPSQLARPRREENLLFYPVLETLTLTSLACSTFTYWQGMQLTGSLRTDDRVLKYILRRTTLELTVGTRHDIL